MDLGYQFSRHKVPRGFSYPMKRGVLDAAIAARGLQSVASVVFSIVDEPPRAYLQSPTLENKTTGF
jgi:hypothetical protein